ncbi:hypothetical protein Tco_1497074, partial [Tanacetum coccineum]
MPSSPSSPHRHHHLLEGASGGGNSTEAGVGLFGLGQPPEKGVSLVVVPGLAARGVCFWVTNKIRARLARLISTTAGAFVLAATPNGCVWF